MGQRVFEGKPRLDFGLLYDYHGDVHEELSGLYLETRELCGEYCLPNYVDPVLGCVCDDCQEDLHRRTGRENTYNKPIG